MPDWLNSLLSLEALVPVGLLVIVLLLDFVFRRNVYNRSDPLSFSLLGFSFLLVVTDVALKVIRLIEKRKDPNYHGADDFIFLAIAFGYVVLVFVIFLSARSVHLAFQEAQERVIHKYLEELKASSSSGNGVWGALEALGKNMIEPDLFEKNPAKEEKRVKFLRLVKDLAKVDIVPEDEQRKLLVGNVRERFWARVSYIFTFFFALAVTLYFFAIRD